MRANEKEDGSSMMEIYTTLSEAKEEIWRRWNDEQLRKKVKEYLGEEFPDVFGDAPKAAIFRFIATPNFEFRLFSDLAKMSGLNQVYVEFLEDKFCTRNQDKVSLGKMKFLYGKNERRKKIIDIQESENKKFSAINTLWGESLVDFHHRIFSTYGDVCKFDVSKLKSNGEDTGEMYKKFLALFLCNGILFENYIEKDNSYEKQFTKNIVMPAVNELFKRFGLKPLIVPLLPFREEEFADWMWYENHLDK